MRSLFYIFSFFFFWPNVKSQELLPQGYDTIQNEHMISFSGVGFFQTSHLRNEISNVFLSGGFISDEMKQNSRLSENESGRIGGELSGDLIYRSGQSFFKNRDQLGWLIKLGFSNTFGAQYSKDAFDLLFFGNQSMLGEEAVISNTSAFNLSYYKAGFGIFNMLNKNSITLNIVLGNSAVNMEVDRGNLVFNADGSQIDVATDITIERTNSPTSFQGIGAAIDFELHAEIKDVPGISGFFQLSGKNLGIMYMHQMERLQLNTTANYQGFSFSELTDLVNYSDSDYTSFFDSLGFSRSSSSRLMILPGGAIQAGKIVDDFSSKKFQSFFGVRVLTNIIHKPMVYAGGHFSLNNWMSVGGQLTFGGYGVFRGGLYAHAKIKKCSIGIGTEDAPGFIAKSTFGKSVLMRLTWKI